MNVWQSRGWLQSPAWDGFWLLSGLWTPLLLGLAGASTAAMFGAQIGGGIGVVTLLMALGLVHRLTTTYGVLASPMFRSEITTNLHRYVWLPAGIVVTTFALCLAFTFHADMGFSDDYHLHYWPYFVLANVFILWEMWHFCAQDFGVLSIYRVRAGQKSKADRTVDRWFCTLMAFGVNLPLYVYKLSVFPRVWLNLAPFLGLHGVSQERLALVASIALTVGMIGAAWVIVRELRKPNRSVPKALYCTLIGAYSVLLYTSSTETMIFFFAAHIVHHWMVAIGLFSRVEVSFHRGAGHSLPASIGRYLLRFGPFVAAGMFWYLSFSRFDLTRLEPLPPAQLYTSIPAEHLLKVGLIAGVFFALNYLHYYYDACFYKLREPAVRRRVAPYLLG